ncbi:hypothetical protein HZF08_16275 [Paenibacillus sp. CGMCC 1.16610]|uniref:Uncharacterized protein n=1 Tax=Paenibacillus anseongense TaxID=2682845 RepID=A0ABW9UJV6_9BACL|nr:MULTISPECIES: ABC-three component system middle component 2 [Paenibacillus]MBA2939870.1 hypothetical protein [Paenibacillus sp. CGMCC 1.16610]MVQ39530.1 hypothetical protein [Paenibacillus anseongense]
MEDKNPTIEFSDFVESAMRILILLSKFEKKKSFKMTFDKIMLYDFYMKFPNIMIPEREDYSTGYTFLDHYSFYHWKPDRDKYHGYLRYLVAKKLVDRNIKSNEFCYEINNNGSDSLEILRSAYAIKLGAIADYIKINIISNSDSKVENDIIEQSFKLRKLLSEEVTQQ